MRHAWGLDLDTEVDEGTGVLDVCSSPLTTIDSGGLPQLLFWSLITFSATKHGRICVRCTKNGQYNHQSPCGEYGGWSPPFHYIYLGVHFDVLLVESKLLHVLNGRIVFAQVLRLLLLQLVFGRREVLLRLLHIVACATGGFNLSA